MGILLNVSSDDIVIPYIPMGLCRCVNELGSQLDSAMEEKVIKLLEVCLKSPYLPTRISVLRDVINVDKMIDIVREYIMKHLGDSSL